MQVRRERSQSHKLEAAEDGNTRPLTRAPSPPSPADSSSPPEASNQLQTTLKGEPPLHSTPSPGDITATMSLLRTSRLITSPRARLHVIPNLTAARLQQIQQQQQQRSLTATSARSAGDTHAHEDHYDQPSGWLFGVKPGEKYENEGWENMWYYGFFGSLLFGVVGYCYKPDTR